MKHNFPEVKIAEDPDQLNRSFNLKSSPPPPPKNHFLHYNIHLLQQSGVGILLAGE